MNDIVENESKQPTPNPTDPSEVDTEQMEASDQASDQIDESEEDELQSEETSMEDLMDLYEESFKRFAEGEVVTGRVISVDKDYVIVDIGYKSEGQIRIHEFQDETGQVDVKMDDKVEVMVEWWDDENEVVVLSKEKAEKVKVWEEIKRAYEADEPVEGVIASRVKGGFSVDIGVNAFLPGSQADLRPVRNLTRWWARPTSSRCSSSTASEATSFFPDALFLKPNANPNALRPSVPFTKARWWKGLSRTLPSMASSSI